VHALSAPRANFKKQLLLQRQFSKQKLLYEVNISLPHPSSPLSLLRIKKTGYPTLKIYPVEKTFNPYTKKSAKLPTDYNGPRTAKGMVDTVLAGMPDMVCADMCIYVCI
jgi:hypothetical protein